MLIREREPVNDRKTNGEIPSDSVWERFWRRYSPHEIPGSLELSDDFINTLRSKSKVLEVGCGTGRVLKYLFKKRHIQGLGIDINPSAIVDAKKHKHNKVISYMIMDGADLKFKDNVFDNVVMTGVIGGVELPIRKKILKEAFRVVKPGGTVAVAEFKYNNDPEKLEKYTSAKLITGEDGTRIIQTRKGVTLFYAKHFTEDELIELFCEAGFTSVQTRGEVLRPEPGIGDGIVEKRRQYTVWGTKPPVQQNLL